MTQKVLKINKGKKNILSGDNITSKKKQLSEIQIITFFLTITHLQILNNKSTAKNKKCKTTVFEKSKLT